MALITWIIADLLGIYFIYKFFKMLKELKEYNLCKRAKIEIEEEKGRLNNGRKI